MHVRELFERIGQQPLPPVLLFCPGTAPFQKETYEPYLADQAVQRIVDTHVDPGMHDLVYRVFYADEAPIGEIVLESKTMPFLADRRVVVVRNAESYETMSGERGSPLAPLIEYLKTPSETTLLLLITSHVDKRKKFYKACKAAGDVVECPKLDGTEMEAWIRAEARRLNKDINRAAIQELVARAGNRLSDVNNAVSLVAGYVGESASIRVEDVVAACADVAEESIWALTDAIAVSAPEKALRALHELLDCGKSPDEIMRLINWLLESAYRASPATSLTVKSSFVERKVLPLAEKLGVAKLKDAFALCTDTHFLLRSTGVDRDLALELLVIKLSAPRRRPAQGAAAR